MSWGVRWADPAERGERWIPLTEPLCEAATPPVVLTVRVAGQDVGRGDDA